jgi:hypothetical protein
MAPRPVFIVPFSHLDLFWTGTRHECLARGNVIIARALDLLERFPEFRFLVETMNFLEHYLSCHPQDEARVHRLAQEGRLELAPLWSGIYQNLPGGESLVRNILLAKRWTAERFAVDPEVAHFGDLPGFTPQFPQIAAKSGVRHALLSRGGPASAPLFRWRAPDGSEILSYYVVGGYAVLSVLTDWHKDYAAMTSGRMPELLEQAGGGLPYPALRHWGCDLYAPHENLVLNARRWNSERSPQLRFATFREYFAAVATTPDLPALQGELPSAWPNIESSWPDVWPEDMPCEAALRLAEFLCAACRLRGWRDLPRGQLAEAWRALLDGMDHNQNGQGGGQADADKLQLKRFARYTAERIRDRMAARLAATVPAPSPDAVPVVVFNPLSWRRDGLVTVRVAVFGSERSSDIADWDGGARLIDAQGRTVPYVVLRRTEALSLGLEIAFPAASVPAAGWATWWLVPGTNPIDETRTCTAIVRDEDADRDPAKVWRYTPDRSVQTGPRRHMDSHVYTTSRLRLSIDAVTGEIDVEDAAGRPLLKRMRLSAVEERRGNYIFDMTPSGREFSAILDAVETLDDNAVWCRIRLRGTLHGMPWRQVITLRPDSEEIAIENEIDWREPRWIRVQQLFPWAGDGDEVRYGVPFGSVRFPEVMPGEVAQNSDEVPAELGARLRLARHWVDIGGTAGGLSIGADHRMWEFDGTTLRAYMLRGAGYCAGLERESDGSMRNIARPPHGTYRFRYLLRPRRAPLAEAASYRCGWELDNPLFAPSAAAGRPGTSGFDRTSLLDFTDLPAVATAIKPSEDGDAVVARLFDAGGTGCALRPPRLAGAEAYTCDLLERGREPVAAMGPHEIRTLVWNLPA